MKGISIARLHCVKFYSEEHIRYSFSRILQTSDIFLYHTKISIFICCIPICFLIQFLPLASISCGLVPREIKARYYSEDTLCLVDLPSSGIPCWSELCLGENAAVVIVPLQWVVTYTERLTVATFVTGMTTTTDTAKATIERASRCRANVVSIRPSYLGISTWRPRQTRELSLWRKLRRLYNSRLPYFIKMSLKVFYDE